ncbi:hypothetical protein PIB30_043618 [Stylosanthes scabra]|uniref:Uncharacterized protein n=1 Tax=Stylosanthes scabra TaxID=79078 RepID=A0ABU6VDZ8_9FABA|nr:hypothetical protein [Stylosanthes scabra]
MEFGKKIHQTRLEFEVCIEFGKSGGLVVKRSACTADLFESKSLTHGEDASLASSAWRLACLARRKVRSISGSNNNKPRSKYNLSIHITIHAGLHWCVCIGASGAYALAPISTLGVLPKAIGAYALALGCVRTGSRNGLLGFVCDILVPLTFFSHFHSELFLLKPKTLERTHQGIVQNGKQFKTQ